LLYLLSAAVAASTVMFIGLDKSQQAMESTSLITIKVRGRGRLRDVSLLSICIRLSFVTSGPLSDGDKHQTWKITLRIY
jgi:hypothetical protein